MTHSLRGMAKFILFIFAVCFINQTQAACVQDSTHDLKSQTVQILSSHSFDQEGATDSGCHHGSTQSCHCVCHQLCTAAESFIFPTLSLSSFVRPAISDLSIDPDLLSEKEPPRA